jgi:hypothetical protein
MTNRTHPETPAGGPLGDTGDGNTGVPEFEQGISNRPGDRAGDAVTARDEGEGDSAGATDDGDDGVGNTDEDIADRSS